MTTERAHKIATTLFNNQAFDGMTPPKFAGASYYWLREADISPRWCSSQDDLIQFSADHIYRRAQAAADRHTATLACRGN